MKKFDVIIVGAGPAGLFAANELAGKKKSVLVIEQGKEPLKRNAAKYREDAVFGVGGAGAYSDGKMNLSPEIGGEPLELKFSAKEIQGMIDKLDRTMLHFGAPKSYSGTNGKELSELKRKANKAGIEFVAGKQRHIGTDRIKKVIDKMYKSLKRSGISFQLETSVEEIKKKGKEFILKTGKGEFSCAYLIACCGRAKSYWLREQAKKLGAKTKFGPIDVGVRVEFPAEVYEGIEKVMYDAKFRLYTGTYDDMVRTFCTNPRGFVSTEKYEQFVLVNGHAEHERKSSNTNLALLTRVHLTDPVEDSTEYGRSIAMLATNIGGGKPILQRYKDLEKGRRSTWERLRRSPISPTLEDVTPGDISMALPQRIVTNIIEAVEKLDLVIPGIASDTTLIYAPEIKFYDTKYFTDEFLETSAPNLFVAGDASGYSRGIVYAGVTGMIAAQGVLKKKK